MRKLLPVVFSSLALISSGALAADPVKPETVKPSLPPQAGQPDPGASTGPSKPDTVEQQDDERKASEAKEKLKKKPGYQDEAPSPRASHTGPII